MRRTQLLLPLIAAVCLGVLVSRPAIAAEGNQRTPEGAVATYVNAVAHRDFSAVVSSTYVDGISKSFDFVAQTSRSRRLSPSSPMPPSDPFFIAINKANFTALIARQVQGLTYGLMSSSQIARENAVAMDAAEADAFVGTVQAKRLSGLLLVKVGVPNPTLLSNKMNQSNWDKMARMLGADTQTERVALLSFEGATYVLGFGLARYGDNWYVSYQGASIVGEDPFPVPTPITPEAFETLLR